MDIEAQSLALQQYKDRQAAMKGYVQTGDIGPVLQADPKFGLELQASLMKMKTEQRKEAVEALAKGADFMTKALPFLNEKTWPAFWQDAQQIPVLRGIVPKDFDPNWIATAQDRLARTKEVLQRPIAAGGSVWDPRTRSWMTPPPKPMGEYERARLDQFDRKLDQEGASLDEKKRYHDLMAGKTGKQTDWLLQAYKAVKGTDAYRDEKDPDKRVAMVEREAKRLEEAAGRIRGEKPGGGGLTLQQRAAQELERRRRGTTAPAPAPAAPTAPSEEETEEED